MVSLICSIAIAGTPAADPFGNDLPEHMQYHFAAATNAAWYIALDDLERVKDAAKQLDHDAPEGMPPTWLAGVDQMRSAARALAAATDRHQAARLSADLASACAACHAATGQGPSVPPEEAVVPQASEAGRHGMAAYSLWVGLVVPSDATYLAGAAALAPPAIPDGGAAEQVAAYAQITQRAPAAVGAERSAIWAQAIASCADCHRAAQIDVDP